MVFVCFLPSVVLWQSDMVYIEIRVYDDYVNCFDNNVRYYLYNLYFKHSKLLVYELPCQRPSM